MVRVANPLLQQVLYRRQLRRRARRAATCWVIFGGLHIAVWWAAFEHDGVGWPEGLLGAVVWPLLVVATVSFVVFVYYTARWFTAPGNPKDYDWLERPGTGPLAVDTAVEDEPAVVGREPLVS